MYRTGQQGSIIVLETVSSENRDATTTGSFFLEHNAPAQVATQVTPAQYVEHHAGMQEGNPLEWDIFKAAVDDLAACEGYGTCHPKFVFSSGLNDILKFCGRSSDDRAALRDAHGADAQEECFDKYMSHLLQFIVYVEQSGYKGEKTFKSAAGAWLRWGGRPENWQTVNDSLLWQAVRRLDETAVPLFRALGWRTIDLAAGPSDNVGSASSRGFLGGGIKVSELRSDQLLELVLGN